MKNLKLKLSTSSFQTGLRYIRGLGRNELYDQVHIGVRRKILRKVNEQVLKKILIELNNEKS